MKKTQFTLLPLAMLISAAVQAESLDVINVISENTGAKSKTNVVTTEISNKRTETDLRGLLNEEPSINFGGGTGTSQWVTIRGMGQDQIDIKVDDTYSDVQVFHHQGRFMSDPSLMKIVNVQKGTGSASAGIGATSGAIVAETVSAKDLLKEDQRIGFKVNAGASSNKGWQKGASVFAKSGVFDALISGNWVIEKDYKAGNGQNVLHSGLGERGLLAKVGVDINEDQRIELSHRQERHYGERNFREEFDFTLSDPNGKNGGGYRITTTDTTNLQWIGKNMGFVSRVKANVYYMDTKREGYNMELYRGNSNSPTFTEYSKDQIITKGANLNLDSDIGSSHMIKYGVNWRQEIGKPNSLTAGRHNQKKDDLGFYAEGIWGINDFTFTTGLRYDYFKFLAASGKKVSKGAVNPSFGIIWEATSDLSFNSSLNYATRSPRFHEVALAGSSTPVATVVDNIKPEKSRNIEVGFNYKWSDSFSLNGSYFWQHIRDVLARNEKTNVFYNGGKLRNSGYELGAAYKYAGLTARAGVAYSKPKLDGKSVDETYQAIQMGRTWTTGLSYKFEQPSVEIGWRGRFVEHTNYIGSVRGVAGPARRAGYGVNDFYINWTPVKDLNINLAVNNAFNKYYSSHSQRNNVNSLPGVGRDFRVNVNYTF